MFTCQGQCPLGQTSPLMTLGLKWIWGLPQGTLTGPERPTDKLQFGSVGKGTDTTDSYSLFLFPNFAAMIWLLCGHLILVLFTLRQTGAVVLVQAVSWGAETHARTIRKLPAKMFATPVSVAAAVGGQTHCEEANTHSYRNKDISLFFLLWWQRRWCGHTFVAVVSVETMCTFAGIGFKAASASRAVLAWRRQALIHSCKQEASGNSATKTITEYQGVCATGYLCTSSRTPPGERKKSSQPRDAAAINCAGCGGLSSCCGKAKISLASS